MGSKEASHGKREDLRWVPVEKLRQLKRNPQYQTEAQMDALRRSIDRDGFLAPILVRPLAEAPGFFEVVSGNHRLIAARENGMVSVPVVVVEMDDESAKRVAINLNTIHGSPLAEQLAPFLADMADETLAEIHIEQGLLDDVLRFDAVLKERLASLELPDSLDTRSSTSEIEQCSCPKCGKRHIRGSRPT